MSATGRCLCGAVKLTAEGLQGHFHACHCSMCRRLSGGSPFFGASVKSVTFEGEESITRFTSSEWAERGFCNNCGTSLFYFLKPTQGYTLSIGLLDDASRLELAREISIDHKPPAYALVGDHPRMTEAEVFAAFAPPPKE